MCLPTVYISRLSATRAAGMLCGPDGARRSAACASPHCDALRRGHSWGRRLRAYHRGCYPITSPLYTPLHHCSHFLRVCHIHRVVGAFVRRTECMAMPCYAGAPMAADCVHITQGTSQLVVTYEYYGFTAVTSRTLAVYAVLRVIVCCCGLAAL